MTICVTRKLATSIELNPERLPAAPQDERQRWYANLVRADRFKYMLVTDATTLVSVVFPGKGITTPEAFAEAASELIREYFGSRGWGELLSTYDIESAAVEFTKTDNKRVLGSMTDFTFQIQWLLAERGQTLRYVCDFLNHNPMKHLGYDTPEGILEKSLAERRQAWRCRYNAE